VGGGRKVGLRGGLGERGERRGEGPFGVHRYILGILMDMKRRPLKKSERLQCSIKGNCHHGNSGWRGPGVDFKVSRGPRNQTLLARILKTCGEVSLGDDAQEKGTRKTVEEKRYKKQFPPP